jgi:hypothetical protein
VYFLLLLQKDNLFPCDEVSRRGTADELFLSIKRELTVPGSGMNPNSVFFILSLLPARKLLASNGYVSPSLGNVFFNLFSRRWGAGQARHRKTYIGLPRLVAACVIRKRSDCLTTIAPGPIYANHNLSRSSSP